MAPAAVADVVVAFLRLTFEFEEPREEEGCREKREEETVPSDLNAASRYTVFLSSRVWRDDLCERMVL